MDKITKEELLEMITTKIANSKNNNLIIAGNDTKSIIDKIPNTSFVSFVEDKTKNSILYNIKINLKEIKIPDIFKYIISHLQNLNVLNKEEKYHIPFDNKIDIWKLDRILKKYNVNIQLIFYNTEVLSTKEQELFNELYYYFSYNLFIISLINNHFKTYSLSNNRILDSREDYQRYILKKIKK